MKVGDLVRVWYEGEYNTLIERRYLEDHGYLWVITKIKRESSATIVHMVSLADGFVDNWWWRREPDGTYNNGIGIYMRVEACDESR